jgi:hypothetical protein
VQVYKAETKEIVRRFINRRITFPDCIAALDAALARFIPRLTSGQTLKLRAIMLANNEAIMGEMAMRSDQLKAWDRSTVATKAAAPSLFWREDPWALNDANQETVEAQRQSRRRSL